MSTTTARATEADLWERSRDARCELVDGEIREMSPAGYSHGRVIIRLTVLLARHVEGTGVGVLLDSSTGFRLPNGNVRAPDIAFLTTTRAPAGPEPRGF